MSRLGQLSRALLAASLCAGLHAPSAVASHAQMTYFEAPGLLLSPVTRPATIATLQRLGVRALRVELSWRAVAPRARSVHRPSFEATNPAAYDWSLYDPLIEEARGLGWRVLLTVTSPVPRWAQANPHKGSFLYHPDARQFERFMTAVGRHYREEVSLFSIWNEPNHHEFLEPQFNPNGTPASPGIYRALYQAGYAGLLAAGMKHPAVLIGETAPEGETRPLRRSRSNLAPLMFLRGVLCLNSRYRRAGSCGRLPASGWGVHPYANGVGPFYVPRDHETVTIGSLSRITHALDRAGRAGALTGHLPVYITEFGVMSKPNRYQGVPVSEQAEWDAIAERISYSNPRVASFSQYLLRDDPIRRRSVGFQTGLEYVNGRAKPLLAAFPVPLTVTRSGGRYRLWGLIRPAGEATRLTVESRRPGASRFTALATVGTNAAGYWALTSTVAARQWRVRWVSAQGKAFTGPPIRAR
jgi:hypothetical protein